MILKRESHGIQQIHSLCVTCVSRQPTRLTKSSIRFRQKETTNQLGSYKEQSDRHIEDLPNSLLWLHKTARIQFRHVIDVQQVTHFKERINQGFAT